MKDVFGECRGAGSRPGTNHVWRQRST